MAPPLLLNGSILYLDKKIKGDALMYLFLGILLILCGLVMVIYPEFVYELTESWKSDAIGTPSEWYIYSTRFGGVMFILAGAAGIVIQFLY